MAHSGNWQLRELPVQGHEPSQRLPFSPALNMLAAAECCIFHRQRQFGEWSDEEDSDAECECGEPGSSGGGPGGELPQPEV